MRVQKQIIKKIYSVKLQLISMNGHRKHIKLVKTINSKHYITLSKPNQAKSVLECEREKRTAFLWAVISVEVVKFVYHLSFQ